MPEFTPFRPMIIPSQTEQMRSLRTAVLHAGMVNTYVPTVFVPSTIPTQTEQLQTLQTAMRHAGFARAYLFVVFRIKPLWHRLLALIGLR